MNEQTVFLGRQLEFPQMGTSFAVDICKRISQCVLCQTGITKGSRRVVLQQHLKTPFVPKPGSKFKGMIFKRKVFFHPQCLSDYLTADDFNRQDSCYECGVQVHTRVNFTMAKKHGAHKPLCPDCVRSERWRYCRSCTLYTPRYSASEIIDETIPSGHFCCDWCQEENDILTVKVRKRLRRAEKETL